MPNDDKTSAAVQEALDSLDVDMRGVVRIQDITGTPLAVAAVKLLPGVKSIVVLGMKIELDYFDLISFETDGGARQPTRYRKHIEELRQKLNAAIDTIARSAEVAGFPSLQLLAADVAASVHPATESVPYHVAAEAAGLGQVGMSGLLVTREHGPRVMLGLCLTGAELASTARENTRACRYCIYCIFKCPAKAIDYPNRKEGERYVVDTAACTAFIAGNGGCAECMRVCPVASPLYTTY